MTELRVDIGATRSSIFTRHHPFGGFQMRHFGCVLCLFAGVLIVTPASATPYQRYMIVGSSLDPAVFSSFSLLFSDSDYDGVFSPNELTNFSGIQYFPSGTAYTQIIEAPDIVDIADGGNSDWIFASSAGDQIFAAPDSFNYRRLIVDPPPPTPLPPAFALFASGLGAMGLIGWLRRKKFA